MNPSPGKRAALATGSNAHDGKTATAAGKLPIICGRVGEPVAWDERSVAEADSRRTRCKARDPAILPPGLSKSASETPSFARRREPKELSGSVTSAYP